MTAARLGEPGAARPARRAPHPVRWWRMARLSAHLVEGLATTALVFPFVEPHRRQRLIRGWSRRLLRVLRVELATRGAHPAQGLGSLGRRGARTMVVANHVSWLDIFVLNAVHPLRFVAKVEIARWPLVGRLVSSVGTLYIDRSSRRALARMNEVIHEALAAGEVVGVFPEGTTTDGTQLLPFKGSLVQPVVASSGTLQPVALRYCDAEGAHSRAPSYAGEVSLLESVWRIVSEPRLVAEVAFIEPVVSDGHDRASLVRHAEREIRRELGIG